MKKIIAIIGCGAVGAAQFYHLVEQLIQEQLESYFEIVIFEKFLELGHGIAYRNDEHTNLLNRSANTISLIHNKPDDFVNWLIANKFKWRSVFPKIQISNTKELFVPRALFGMYIEDIVQQSLVKARKNELKVSIVHHEVVNIIKNKEKYKILTHNNWQFYTDILILTIGNLSSNRFHHFKQHDNFFTTPYPTTKLNIPSHSTVGILGSRLSAVDVVIALKSKGHQNNLTFISRNGYLPAIRAPYRAHELKILTAKVIEKNLIDGKLSLLKIIKLLIKEMQHKYNQRISLREWFERPIDPLKYFQHEFIHYKLEYNVAWQSIFMAMNYIIEHAWHYLNDFDKSIFCKFYKSKWISRRVGIPLCNAKKIYHLFLTRQLKLINGFEKLEYDNNQFIIKANSKNSYFDYIIDATGNGEELQNIDSPLISNMLNSGLIQSNQYGGIDVDFQSSKIINQNKAVEQYFYVIGNLTSGTYFFTSVLELNVQHALKIAKNIIFEFKSVYQLDRLEPDLSGNVLNDCFTDLSFHQDKEFYDYIISA